MPKVLQAIINMCLLNSKSQTGSFYRPGHLSLVVLLALVLCSLVDISYGYNCYRKESKENPRTLAVYPEPKELEDSTKRSRRSTNARTAVVFDDGDYLILNSTEHITGDEFSLSLNLYLEGGQPLNAQILVLENVCYGFQPWRLEVDRATPLKPESGLKFTIEDVYRQRSGVALNEYKIHRWYHITIINSKQQLKLYVDGTRINTDAALPWSEFTSPDCLRLMLGGNHTGFRGKIQHMYLSSEALSALNVKKLELGILSSDTAWMNDEFTDLSNWYYSQPPATQAVYLQGQEQRAQAPPCGKTVCDDPRIVRQYVRHTELHNHKTLNLEFVYFANSDGSSPAVTSDDLQLQTNFIAEAFRPWNISFKFSSRVIQNSTLNRAAILVDCYPHTIGDGRCSYTQFCDLPRTNYDGGDCLFLDDCPCTHQVGDGVCDLDCNIATCNWDGGDCCTGAPGELCVDPDSPHRSYLHISELSPSLQLNSTKLNIVLLDWAAPSMYGIASMPWQHNPRDVFPDSVAVSPSMISQRRDFDTLVHEIGHAFGLWHVEHGIHEVESCSDPCLETHASLELGDLCADTSPTGRHKGCSDPPPNSDVCGVETALRNTPYNNFMSYSNGTCSMHKVFTPQQSGRMHCYIDLVRNTKLTSNVPSATPLPIQIIYSDESSVTLSWVPPFNSASQSLACASCRNGGRIVSYASSAFMVNGDRMRPRQDEEYSPKQATGPPDSETCMKESEPSHETFMPYQFYLNLFGWPRCTQVCMFVFSFEEEVIVQMMRLWIPWWRADRAYDSPIESIELVNSNKETVKLLTKVNIQCDHPYTRVFDDDIPAVKYIIISTHTSDIAFDSIELTSHYDSPLCDGCSDLSYRVSRSPPFSSGVEYATTLDTTFEDTTVEEGSTYRYHIRAMRGSVKGQSSPDFVYTHSSVYCGNGYQDVGEDCDDGNQRSGDGCSHDCKTEAGFVCRERPSFCLKIEDIIDQSCAFKFTHDQSGCGFYVPSNYSDQWAAKAEAYSRHGLLNCKSPNLMAGPTSYKQSCDAAVGFGTWQPCQFGRLASNQQDYYVKFEFERAVVPVAVIVHLGPGTGTTSLEVSLLEEGNLDRPHYLDRLASISCFESPVTISVKQDLSKPFFKVKAVLMRLTNRQVSIGGVRLRTFERLDPVEINSCTGNLYHIDTASCISDLTQIDMTCPEYQIENGNATCEGNNPGDQCHVSCVLGYQASSVSSLSTCRNGAWTPAVECQVITCGKPVVSFGLAVCRDSYKYDSVCEIECTDSNVLVGNGTLIKCLESGVWTSSRAYCEARCPEITTSLNARPLEADCEGPGTVEQRCRIECDTGYNIYGEDAKTRTDKAFCEETGEWNIKCVRTLCPALPQTLAGMYTCSGTMDHNTGEVHSGSVCTITCPSDQSTRVVRCTHNGQWNDTLNDLSCDLQPSVCPHIESPSMNFECHGDTAGSRCILSCVERAKRVYLRLPSGNTTTLGRDQYVRWSGKLRCDVKGNWAPNIEQLSCQLPCYRTTGDGWCDAADNREVCGFDGGDCCWSTSRSGIVQHYPSPCTLGNLCICNDPLATENDPSLSNQREGLRVQADSDYVIERRP